MNSELFELCKAVLVWWADFEFNHPDEAKEKPEMVQLATEFLGRAIMDMDEEGLE